MIWDCIPSHRSDTLHMQTFVWLAIALVVLWILARVVFAITSFFLHLLLLAALVFGAIWVYNKYMS